MPVSPGVALCVGSVHLDVELAFDEPRTTTVRTASRSLVAPGGKAGNVATHLARWGAEVRLLGCVGDDPLAAVSVDGPRAAGVDVGGVETSDDAGTGVATIWLDDSGDKEIGLVAGANDRWPPGAAERAAGQVAALPDGSVVVVDLEIDPAVVAAVVETASSRGLALVVDPSPPGRATDHVLGAAAHVVPDHREAAAIVGRDVGSVESAVAAARSLVERGARVAHVKLADGGAVVATADVAVHLAAPEVERVDATGAGDAFAAAVAWSLLRDPDPVAAGRAGVAAAAWAVQHFGSHEAVLSLGELESVVDRVAVHPCGST